MLIPRKLHIPLTDYPYVALMSTAPYWAGFKNAQTPTLLTRILAGGILASGLTTAAEGSAVKKVSYKTHLVLDTIGGATALAAPWIFGFARNRAARNVFIGAGVFGLVAGLLSKRAPSQGGDDYDDFWD